MKKWIFLLLFIPAIALAGFSVGGVTDPASVGGVTEPASVGGVTSDYSTDYTQDANCMGAWYMNNNGGNETDRSGENETLTQMVGTIPTDADVPSGYSGTSRDFESGESEYLTHADNGSTDIFGVDQHITVAAWIKLEGITNALWRGVVAKYDVGSNLRQYNLAVVGTDTDKYKVAGVISSDGTSGNSTFVYSTTTDYAAGSWQHIAMVYNDTDVRVYVNGSEHCTPGAHTAGIGEKSAAFCVGAYFNGGSPSAYFDGLIDEPIVFDRSLSSTEIADLYNDGISGNNGGSD